MQYFIYSVSILCCIVRCQKISQDSVHHQACPLSGSGTCGTAYVISVQKQPRTCCVLVLPKRGRVLLWQFHSPLLPVHHIRLLEVEAEVVVEGVAELELTLVAVAVKVHHSRLVAVEGVVEVEAVVSIAELSSPNLEDLMLVTRSNVFVLKLLAHYVMVAAAEGANVDR